MSGQTEDKWQFWSLKNRDGKCSGFKREEKGRETIRGMGRGAQREPFFVSTQHSGTLINQVL